MGMIPGIRLLFTQENRKEHKLFHVKNIEMWCILKCGTKYDELGNINKSLLNIMITCNCSE